MQTQFRYFNSKCWRVTEQLVPRKTDTERKAVSTYPLFHRAARLSQLLQNSLETPAFLFSNFWHAFLLQCLMQRLVIHCCWRQQVAGTVFATGPSTVDCVITSTQYRTDPSVTSQILRSQKEPPRKIYKNETFSSSRLACCDSDFGSIIWSKFFQKYNRWTFLHFEEFIEFRIND